jgi:putative FmdB family regulatory protein
MPTYEFRCPAGHEFEHFFRSIGQSQSTMACPVCGAESGRRMSAAGLVFKGSGFYITDYGKDGKKDQRQATGATSEGGTGGSAEGGAAPSETKAEAPGATPSAPSSDAKGDAKPAAKPEAKPAPSSPPPKSAE